MPIQWSGRITSPQMLAGVIQGEAGNSFAGQFAVAATMYNRMSTPGAGVPGAGSLNPSLVVTPTQFNGYNPNPSPSAMALANDLWAGNAPQGGDTGNALYFSASQSPDYTNGTGSMITPGGVNIGGNVFSDQFGSPSANFLPPTVGGTATTPNVDLSNPSGVETPMQLGSGPGIGDPYASYGNDYSLGTVEDGSSLSNPFTTGNTPAGVPVIDTPLPGASGPDGSMSYLDPSTGTTNAPTYGNVANPWTMDTMAGASTQNDYTLGTVAPGDAGGIGTQYATPSPGNSAFTLDGFGQGSASGTIGADAGSYTYQNNPGNVTGSNGITGDIAGLGTGDANAGAGFALGSTDAGASFSGPADTSAGTIAGIAGKNATAAPKGATTVPKAIEEQNQQLQADTAAQNATTAAGDKGIASATSGGFSGLAGTLGALGNKFDASMKDLFVRGAVIVVGFIILAAALVLMNRGVIENAVHHVPV